ncbi:hypothetical protein PLICRDRAFT_31611 [Plicaturopsis crispa FD-325 SS-3]|nr:hypothetical protein PLICRDRAFT_31611 [Plicaturopsis crispa FD-325 SS-3]
MHSFASTFFIATLALDAFACPLTPAVSGAVNSVEGLGGSFVGRQIPAVGGDVNTVEGVAGGAIGTATGLAGGILGRDAPVDGAVAAVEGAVGGVAPRDGLRGMALILAKLESRVTPVTQELNFLTSQNATEEVITPIIDSLEAILGDAVTEMNGFVDLPIGEFDGTTQADVLQMIAVFARVFCGINRQLGAIPELTINGTDYSGDVLKPLLTGIG